MNNPIDDYRASHKLVGVLDHDGGIDVLLRDGDVFRLSGCWPIDPSIYDEVGGWCCTIEKYFGSDERKRRLFRPTSGIDIYEEDIERVTDPETKFVLYAR